MSGLSSVLISPIPGKDYSTGPDARNAWRSGTAFIIADIGDKRFGHFVNCTQSRQLQKDYDGVKILFNKGQDSIVINF